MLIFVDIARFVLESQRLPAIPALPDLLVAQIGIVSLGLNVQGRPAAPGTVLRLQDSPLSRDPGEFAGVHVFAGSRRAGQTSVLSPFEIMSSRRLYIWASPAVPPTAIRSV